MSHRPVLLAEIVEALQPRHGGFYVDGTYGDGGYARAILAAAGCRLVALDRDPAAIARGGALMAEMPGRFELIRATFGAMANVLTGPVDGIVLDLGVSSFQLDTSERGFSFRFDGPLDMRMGDDGRTAADLVAELAAPELERLFRQLGDEPDARRIARAIVETRVSRPIVTTRQLAELAARVKGGRHGRIDPATRVFQALRMAVNDELGELERGLEAAERLLRPDGRLVVVTFHSGEDALVKRFVDGRGGRQPAGSRHLPPVAAPAPRWRWIAKRVRRPGAAELQSNPRARSAKLRVAERVGGMLEDEPAWRHAA